MGDKECNFVAWEEHILCHERGNRLVHYLLKKPTGDLVLGVIGTERSIRHMMYVVSGDFIAAYGPQGPVNASTKWRARREVIEWLTSLVSAPDPSDLPNTLMDNSTLANGSHALLTDQMGSRKFKVQTAEIEWSGVPWVCAKQLNHYPAFCRGETTIMIHSFVYVMGLNDHQYLGYLEDMYEDKKGKKKVKVRWFHHNQDVKDLIPHLNPHPREVFITPTVQVISAESVDGPAIVLTPKHYEICMAAGVVEHNSSSGIHMCFRQFKSHNLRPFTLAKLHGYVNQAILSSIEADVVPKQQAKSSKLAGEDEDNADHVGGVTSTSKRNSNREKGIEKGDHVFKIPSSGNQISKPEPTSDKLKFKLGSKPMGSQTVRPESLLPKHLKVGEQIEVLCQDSGVRGCWFQCKIVKMSTNNLKIKYKDLEDEEGLGPVMEWVSAHKLASPDKLGMRCFGRSTIRPRPPNTLTDFNIEIGTPVDAWWSDGWWEGVVIGVDKSGADSVQIYLPGEGRSLALEKKAMRASKDWVGGKWLDIQVKTDILSCITATPKLSGTKVHSEVVIKDGQGVHDLAASTDGLRHVSSVSVHGSMVNKKAEGNNASEGNSGYAGNQSQSGLNEDLFP